MNKIEWYRDTDKGTALQMADSLAHRFEHPFTVEVEKVGKYWMFVVYGEYPQQRG